MLSALSSTPHAFLDPPSYSFHRSSPSLPSSSISTPLMQGAHLQSTMPSSQTPSPSMKSRPFVSSPGQMFRVYGYTPKEGGAGTTIIVTVRFLFASTETTFLRIVVGTRALTTSVRAASTKRPNEWDLEATAPEYEIAFPGAFLSSTVPLTVQALDGTNTTLDSLTFGDFTYSHRRVARSHLSHHDVSDDGRFSAMSTSGNPNANASSSASTSSAMPSRRSSRPASSSGGSGRSRSINNATNSKDTGSARGQKKQSLIRARRAGSEEDDVDAKYRAVLSMETPTENMGNVLEWDEEERRAGRRLVRFTRVQDGSTLHVVCEAIRPSEYTEGDTVVSCIYRPPHSAVAGDAPASQCCITSVDIIFLLECLVGDIFNIEEKNRIRRNLEGFRPKTVSKNKVGTEEFFQKIMDFPAPKPRNIEKDVKVFDWGILPQALDKIISKYTLYPTIKEKDDGVTTPALESMATPHSQHTVPHSAYSASSSPAPDRPSTSSPTSFPMYSPMSYSSQYGSGSQDVVDGTFMTATALSSAGYDSFLPPPSTTPSPTPLLSGSPEGLNASQPLFSSTFPDARTYGTYTPTYPDDFQRLNMSSSTTDHYGSPPFL